ncbi:Alkaline phosphatase 4 [Sporomusa silvacetica DSM 10669]|uniref:Alkaline phosphatase 4 n=1 Tax=Sporomusa silvacetica DSM 10669 TaxID=1123289 RepID=A0ABZ3IF77_9FIRM|nr:alkaline phosphatase [Sporomusa silvacetica]OZC22601.1 alkaline phosphatase 4 precursor [Sporomusa silvacetica DSM 10669]
MTKRFYPWQAASWLMVALFVAAILPFSVSAAQAPVQNVIIVMTDGTSSTHTTIARWYKGAPLSLDEILVGGVRTYGAESIITDSAPAATAFATGYKTSDKFIGILPDKITTPGVAPIEETLKTKPVPSVLEGAKLAGKATGLVATSNIQHASPAGYSAHWPDRNNYNEIAKQQVYQDIDVVLSGGKKYLLPKEQGGERVDGENLIAALNAKGYEIVETRDAMNKFTGKKLWGLFAPDAMAYDIDRQQLAPTEPSLVEMTKKAIEILSKNKNGFFLFVEASKVDWASHANDPKGVVSDVLAYDAAIQAALDFAKKDGHTLVLAFADHGNGGMSIGSKATDATYSKTRIESLLQPLKKAVLTGEGIERVLHGNREESTIHQVMSQYYGIDDLTADETKAIQNAKIGSMNSVVGPMLSRRSIIGWTTTGHSGEDLFFYAYGPNHPVGLIENTDIARISAKALGFDLKEVDNKLFVEAGQAFKAIGASVSLDDTDQENKVLIVKKGFKKAEIPISKNIIKISEKSYEMNGIAVIMPRTGKVYIPQQAVELAKAAGF